MTKYLIICTQFILIGVCFAFILLQQYPQLIGHSKGWIQSLFDPAKQASTLPVSYHSAIANTAPSIVHLFEQSTQTNSSGPTSNNHYKSIGSGVIVHKAGWILTNLHVIKNINDINILLADGRRAKATIIGQDPSTDLAMLKINLPHLQAISWIKNSTKARIGDVVLAIGNPFGLNQSVSIGIVSSIERNLNLNTYDQLIQTDAAIHPGNSGGALINTLGQLMGITSALFSSDKGNQGLGFAIPAHTAKFVATSLRQHGRVIRGWVGIDATDINATLANNYHLKDNRGVLVTFVAPDSPAFKSGIQVGDVILQIDNEEADDIYSIMHYIAQIKPGQSIHMDIIRYQSYQRDRLTFKVAEKL